MDRRHVSHSESLESRVLLSGSFASLNNHGILSVVGDGKNNAIEVYYDDIHVRAKRDGATVDFGRNAVKGIWIHAFDGNDSVNNRTLLPSTLIGGAGNDVLLGGSGNDVFDGGAGD